MHFLALNGFVKAKAYLICKHYNLLYLPVYKFFLMLYWASPLGVLLSYMMMGAQLITGELNGRRCSGEPRCL